MKAKVVKHSDQIRVHLNVNKMASKLEEDLICPVCHEIYKDPVILTCVHSVCEVCLQRFWESEGSRECPHCRRKCSKGIYPLNMELKIFCQEITTGSKEHYSLQSEKLKLCLFLDTQLCKFFVIFIFSFVLVMSAKC